jgi:hypothetical protein
MVPFLRVSPPTTHATCPAHPNLLDFTAVDSSGHPNKERMTNTSPETVNISLARTKRCLYLRGGGGTPSLSCCLLRQHENRNCHDKTSNNKESVAALSRPNHRHVWDGLVVRLHSSHFGSVLGYGYRCSHSRKKQKTHAVTITPMRATCSASYGSWLDPNILWN